MILWRAFLLALLAIVLAGGSLATKAHAAGEDDVFGGTTSPDADGFEVQGSRHDNSGSTPASNSGGSSGPLTQEMRAPRCESNRTRQDQTPICPDNDPLEILCIDGTPAQLPIWVRTQNADGTWTDWSIYRDYSCPQDAALLAAINREWTELQPQPSDINLQPNTGWVIATVPTIAMAGDEPRLHQATLLGADVEILATASDYRWEWGDGSHTATSDPGQPYPNATLTHTYPHASDRATVALTTTWTGEYRVNGGPWVVFGSTISSQSTPVDLVIYDPRSRLVNCDLDGNCRLAANG
ncbi:hypothetical protein [Demequina sp.]|uniref:hypothetical protein n=1 Tax=Demequina sp. TaxID=2050685 RepID=UPI003D11294E